jgi:uncharacterized protein (DUF1800 family)
LLLAGAALAPAAAQMVPDPIFAGGYEAADVPATDAEAARFLTQASFGPTKSEIANLRVLGYGAWMDAQTATPPTLARPYLEALATQAAVTGAVPASVRMDRWFNTAAVGPDQLRQRMAWALSQIMVISDIASEDTNGIAEYWDILARDAFGSYRTLLGDVTFSPQMGRYLSHFRNQKSNGTLSPDENYAREVMQLFSIGLVFRNTDFSPILDGQSQEIPTYDQNVVKEMARVFTGLANPCPIPNGTCNPYSGMFTIGSGYAPMACFPRYHDLGSKSLFIPNTSGDELQRMTLPAGPACPNSSTTTVPSVQQCIDYCLADINGALDALAGHGGVPFDGHPNVPPFVARQLIERFVASNPSPEYIGRVATVFKSSGGNLGQTLRALLLDVEARSASVDPSSGKPREPLLRLISLWRAWDAQTPAVLPINVAIGNYGQVPMGIQQPQTSFLERPLGANTVFNFYQPDYQQPGPIASANLFSPELEIVNESSIATGGNSLYTFSYNSYVGMGSPPNNRPLLNLSSLTTLGSASAMVDEANHRMLYGRMTLSMRASLIKLLSTAAPSGMAAASATDKARALIDLVALSPEYATQQ